MRTIYGINMKLMNGTVCMSSDISIYGCKELRDNVLEKLKQENKNYENENAFNIVYDLFESELYDSASEVPILNKNNNI